VFAEVRMEQLSPTNRCTYFCNFIYVFHIINYRWRVSSDFIRTSEFLSTSAAAKSAALKQECQLFLLARPQILNAHPKLGHLRGQKQAPPLALDGLCSSGSNTGRSSTVCTGNVLLCAVYSRTNRDSDTSHP
jgi:hypothetical protein